MSVKFALIKPEHQHQNIIKLELEDKGETGKGVYLLLYDNMTGPCKYDDWFLTLNEALEFAEEEYGVSIDDWKDKLPGEDG